jgi:hypothetical protein
MRLSLFEPAPSRLCSLIRRRARHLTTGRSSRHNELGGTPVYQVRYRRVRPYLRRQTDGDSLRRVITLHMHSKVLSVPLSIIPRSANAAATKMTSWRHLFVSRCLISRVVPPSLVRCPLPNMAVRDSEFHDRSERSETYLPQRKPGSRCSAWARNIEHFPPETS